MKHLLQRLPCCREGCRKKAVYEAGIRANLGLGRRIQSQRADTGIGIKGPCLNEFRIHALGQNATGHFRRHALRKQIPIGLRGGNGDRKDLAMHLIVVVHRSGLGTLFQAWVAGTDLVGGRHPALGWRVHIATTHFIAAQANLVAEPLAGNKNGHLNAETDLWVEKGADVVVLRKVVQEFLIGRCHRGHLFVKGHAGCIDDRDIGSEDFQAFYEADVVMEMEFGGGRCGEGCSGGQRRSSCHCREKR